MLIHATRDTVHSDLEERHTFSAVDRGLSIWASGYFFDQAGRLYCDRGIAEWLAGQLRTRTLDELVPQMNGLFSLVMIYERPARITCATGRFGIVPVYYRLDSGSVVISDDCWKVVQASGQVAFKESSVLEMISLGYVAGQETLFDGILEMPSSTICTMERDGAAWRSTRATYWRLNYAGEKRRGTEAVLEKEFTDLFASVTQRFVDGVNVRGWSVAFALSGGMDSRLLISLFKHHDCRDISAFSYGPPKHPDAVYAAQIARALDVPHRMIPVESPDFITETLIEEMTRTIGATTRFTCGLGARIVQEALPDSSVYIMGHLGARFFAEDKLLIRTRSQVARLIRHNHFVVTDAGILERIWANGNPRSMIAEAIDRTLDFDPGDSLGSKLGWFNAQQLRRLLARETRTYERFGRWMLPLADHDLVDYVAALPTQLSVRRRLYVNAALSHVYAGDLAAVGQIPLASGQTLTRRELSAWERFKATPGKSWVKDIAHLLSEGRKVARRRKEQYRNDHKPAGADPFDFWWATSEEFRTRVTSMFEGWDGLGGMIDSGALLNLLRGERLPRYFLLFGIPSLLTLVFAQRIARQFAIQSTEYAPYE